MADNDTPNLTKSLKDLEKIADWFESQDEIDVEEGLKKVKQAAKLIKTSKARLNEIENEFAEIEKDIADDNEPDEAPSKRPDLADETIDLHDIPF